MCSRFLPVVLFCLAISIKIFPQNNSVRFETLSLQNGVSLNLTYAILQDSKGYIWFGTMYGLVKYDGRNYTTYRNDPMDSTSISFDDIISLFEDSRGNIWAGTWGGGLNKFDPRTKKFTRFLYAKSPDKGLCDNIVWTINEDDSGNIWVGTQRGGIDKYEVKAQKFIHYWNAGKSEGELPSNMITKIYKDRQGTIWIGTQSGLAKYLPRSNSFETFKNTLKPDKIKGSNLIRSIYETDNNNLWIGTASGLFVFNKLTNKFSSYSPDKNNPLDNYFILSICKGKSKDVWVGTGDGLIKTSSDNSEKIEIYRNKFGDDNTIAGNTILSLMMDKSGVLWIDAYRTGVSKLISTSKDFVNYTYDPDNKNSLGTSLVTFFAQDDKGYIWISGFSSILSRYDPKTNSFKRFRLVLPGSKQGTGFSITSIIKDKTNLWVGTTQGILLFDLKTESQKPLPKEIKKIKEMVNGNITYLLITPDRKLWVGVNERGIFSCDLEDFSYKHFVNPITDLTSYMKNIVQVIYEDKDKNIWLGTLGGLLKLDQATGNFRSFSHNLSDPTSLSNNYVYYLFEDSKYNFWIGTSNGLNKMNKKNNTFLSYCEKDGLPNNVIMSILEDSKGNLWISTNKGIARFDPMKNTFKNFDVEDGLRTNIFYAQSAFIDKEGMFYFGGNNGFTKFDPDKIILNDYIPPVYITKVNAGTDIGNLHSLNTPNDKLQLSFNDNFLQLYFASLDYTNPEKNVYKYNLAGVDEDWIYSGNNNMATYTDLSPGSYTFQVKGSNSDGIWNEEPASMEIIILPPFWRTWWFTSLLIIAGLITIYLIHLIWAQRKIKHALEIERVRAEESERVRKQTAIDFHDELGHRLTRISLLTEIVKRKLGDSHWEVLPLLRKISENSIQLYDGTKDFIWAIDPQNDSLYELLVRLKDFGDEIFTDTNIDFFVKGISIELENTSLSTDMKRHLTLIFKEGMNNSLKHSGGKKVSLESRIIGDEIEIALEDDGAGFKISEDNSGNGLKNMIKRAEKINGQLQINTEPGKGTRISFRGKVKTK